MSRLSLPIANDMRIHFPLHVSLPCFPSFRPALTLSPMSPHAQWRGTDPRHRKSPLPTKTFALFFLRSLFSKFPCDIAIQLSHFFPEEHGDFMLCCTDAPDIFRAFSAVASFPRALFFFLPERMSPPQSQRILRMGVSFAFLFLAVNCSPVFCALFLGGGAASFDLAYATCTP